MAINIIENTELVHTIAEHTIHKFSKFTFAGACTEVRMIK
jgi:hypothetical protein